MCVSMYVCVCRARLKLAEEGEDNGVGPSCAAVGGRRPEKKSLTMDISDCSGCLLCPPRRSGIPSSSHTDSPRTNPGRRVSEANLKPAT